MMNQKPKEIVAFVDNNAYTISYSILLSLQVSLRGLSNLYNQKWRKNDARAIPARE